MKIASLVRAVAWREEIALGRRIVTSGSKRRSTIIVRPAGRQGQGCRLFGHLSDRAPGEFVPTTEIRC